MVAPMDLHMSSWRRTLPHLAESTLPHSFIQPVHEVEVRYAARLDLRPYVNVVLTHPCFCYSAYLGHQYRKRFIKAACGNSTNRGISCIIFPSLNSCPFFNMPNRIRISLLHKAIRDCIFFNGFTGRFV